MATTGTINNTFRTGYAIRIVWEVTSQSVANNTSAVTARVQLVSLGSSYTINSSASKSGSLTINGTSYSFTFTAGLTGNQAKTIFTKSVTIAHAANGSKTCSFSATAGINVTLSGTYYGNVTATGSGVFNTIARASSISSVTSSVSVNGSNAVTVNISRAASSFTHTVVYKFGSYTQTQSNIGTATSYVIPTSWINAMPNATSGTATVTVTTYSGSTKIGTAVSRSFTLTVPTTIVPTISSVTLSEAVAGIATQFGAYVQNKSKLAVTVAAAGTYSSSITHYKTTIDGVSYTAATFTSGLLKTSGSLTVSITVTDSRGRTATTTRTITVAAYSPPTINEFTGFRSLQNGTENYDGTYLNAKVNFTISAVNNRNTRSHTIEYKLQNATSWTALTSGAVYAMNQNVISSAGVLNADNSYNIRLTIRDYFSTVTVMIDIPTAFTLIDYHRGGRSIAFGKVAELTEGIEFGIPAYFSNGETPEGSQDIAIGTDLNDLTSPGFYTISNASISGSILNKPYTSTATGCIITLEAGGSGQRCQICLKGSKGITAGVYERQFYTDSWGGWNCISNGGGRVLWSGAMYMTAGHTAPLSETVSEQQTGVVLVFSRYSGGTAQNYHFNHFFVSKQFVAAHTGSGSQFLMTTDGTLSVVASKYLYIHNDRITGNAINNQTGTAASGITYANNGFVLRYVIGV